MCHAVSRMNHAYPSILNPLFPMRELSVNEIAILEEQGCTAEDWTEILVEDDFTTSSVSAVSFYGHVEIGSLNGSVEVEDGFWRRCCLRNVTLRNVVIGDECVIENIRGYISGYHIGNRCYISDCGIITAQRGTTCGAGETISVLNESGDGNIVLYPGLTSQMAWLMVNFPEVRTLAQNSINTQDIQPSIGNNTRIIATKEIVNTLIGEGAEVRGVTRLYECTVESSDEISTFIGSDVIMEKSIVAPGATVTDGAKVFDSFVGEQVHIGKGFSSETSVFFANSYMDNGESCAAFCGPFSASHHKSTLLIGGAFSFYNAGSGTNQSNHAYKMGPIHWGTLARGTKTASGCHILWPATFGAFSMVMGKVQTHPNTRSLPFSYVIADGMQTYLIPGINLRTVGTWRDVGKWQKRDLRPVDCRRDLVNCAFPNPYVIQSVLEGREVLRQLQLKYGTDAEEYRYKGCLIRHDALVKGLHYYDMALRLFLYEYFQTTSDADESGVQGGTWLDLCGLLAPKAEIDRIIQDVRSSSISSVSELEEILRSVNSDYKANAAAYALHLMKQEGEGGFIDQDYWLREAEQAHDEWLSLIKSDAEKEYAMGDVEEKQLRDFIEKIKA